MIHGGPEQELWLVDYVNTLPFLQSLAGEVYFAPGKSVAAKTSTFDALLAESLERVAGIEAAFVSDRPDPNLSNVEFRFDGRSTTREIDVPLRRGQVLVAVQTWARDLDPGLSGGIVRCSGAGKPQGGNCAPRTRSTRTTSCTTRKGRGV